MAIKYNANTDRDAGSRNTVARKSAAVAAPKKAASSSKAASSKPSASKVSLPNSVNVNPSTSPAYQSYSSSGGPQSAKRAAPSTFGSSGGPQSAQKRTSASAPIAGKRSVNMPGRGVGTGGAAASTKNVFNSNSAMPGEDWMNKKGKQKTSRAWQK